MARKSSPTLNVIDTTDLVAKVRELNERSKELAVQAAALEMQVKKTRMARGSTPPTELYAQIQQLLAARPLTLQEIIEQTKAETNKVKVVILKMQREESGIVNLGNQYRALWFIPDSKLLDRLRK